MNSQGSNSGFDSLLKKYDEMAALYSKLVDLQKSERSKRPLQKVDQSEYDKQIDDVMGQIGGLHDEIIDIILELKAKSTQSNPTDGSPKDPAPEDTKSDGMLTTRTPGVWNPRYS